MIVPPAELEFRRDADRVYARVGGEIDLSNAQQLQHQIERAVAGASSVALDLGGVEYLDSQGVRLLQRLSLRLRERDVELKIIAPRRSIAGQVLTMTEMDRLMPVSDSIDG